MTQVLPHVSDADLHRTLSVLLMNWSGDNFPAERWSTWKARALCQLHVISIKCGRALSIKKTQGNLWLLKEIPLAYSQPERRPFVPRHVSHTFRVQISSGFMKPCFIFAHCNVSVGSVKYGEGLSSKELIYTPSPRHTHMHYGVRNTSHRLGGPEFWVALQIVLQCAQR